jgi:hypothetical protein
MAVTVNPFHRLWRALLLQPSAYEEMREDDNPFVEGLYLIAVMGVVVALFGLVGTLVEWASMPPLADIKDVIYRNLVQMSWYQMLQEQAGQAFVEQFQRNYDLGWQIFPRLFGAPDLGSAALGIVLTPLSLIVGWLIYGILAHVSARLLGGEGSLSQTLGVTALAAAPQLLNLANLFPNVVVGGVVGTWVLICRYMGLRVAHDLTWPRTLVATLLPSIILWLLSVFLAILGLAIAGPFLAEMLKGGGQ